MLPKALDDPRRAIQRRPVPLGVPPRTGPASGVTGSAVTLFRLSPDEASAEPITVRLGRASANRVQIVEGDLREGDRIVLSDTSSWEKRAVRLR